MQNKTIVISGINLRSGGTLSILQECLKYLSENLTEHYKVVALVHKKELFSNIKNIEYIEFPKSIKSYFLRIYYEYFYFRNLSKKLNPCLWLSIHDITPNVISNVKVVYCHNPSPFHKFNIRDLRDLKFVLFHLFYKYVYRINIHSNNYVIVQQNWLRDEFIKMFNLAKDKIIVAYPSINTFKINSDVDYRESRSNKKISFIYPSFPRVFKNFEVICEAVKILNVNGYYDFEVIFTINGKENRYSRWLFSRYALLKNIKFIGLQSREKIFDLYKNADCLLFPSKLETWGLPISEFKIFNKPIIVSDLPYARETVGNYEKVIFFPPNSAQKLAKAMQSIIENNPNFAKNLIEDPDPPFVKNWDELFNILLGYCKNE